MQRIGEALGVSHRTISSDLEGLEVTSKPPARPNMKKLAVNLLYSLIIVIRVVDNLNKARKILMSLAYDRIENFALWQGGSAKPSELLRSRSSR